MTFSRVGKVYKYLVPERKELGVGEAEDVGKRGQTEGPGPGSAVGRRAQAEHRDVREREKRQMWGGELGAYSHHESAKERGPQRGGQSPARSSPEPTRPPGYAAQQSQLLSPMPTSHILFMSTN